MPPRRRRIARDARPLDTRQHGFNLVEIAIGLVIIAFALSAGLMTLSAQTEAQRLRDSNKLIADAREALIGFAIANGRLPCPASAASNGLESPPNGGACTNPHDGFLPGATLGLPNLDSNGYAVDAWQTTANRIRYAVSTANTNALTTANGIKSATIGAMAPDLAVCASAAGITATSCGTATILSNNTVAVILSPGKDAAAYPGGAGADEAANLNGDPVFVSHTPTDAGAGGGGQFDDLVSWIAPGILYNRMIQAGQIP